MVGERGGGELEGGEERGIGEEGGRGWGERKGRGEKGVGSKEGKEGGGGEEGGWAGRGGGRRQLRYQTKNWATNTPTHLRLAGSTCASSGSVWCKAFISTSTISRSTCQEGGRQNKQTDTRLNFPLRSQSQHTPPGA